MRRFPIQLLLLLLWLALFSASPAAAITIGQVDDFQNGTLLGWGGGALPTNIANGGPDGTGDRYLQISSSSSNLGTNNGAQWSGDYVAAGVNAISLDLNNTGATPLALRLTVFGVGGNFTSTVETVLGPSSGWVTVTFGLGLGDLTQTSGSGTLAQTLSGVDTLLLRHDPDPLSPAMEQNPVTGMLGIDNVTAVPEPASGLLGAAGLAALAAGRRPRRITLR